MILGIVLSDATIYYISKEALIKFEQGVNQKEFLYHLFDRCKIYCFIIEPGKRYDKWNKNCIKSYWFKTFSHASFSIIWNIVYNQKKKSIYSGIILKYLTHEGLAYWVIGDGSLHREGRVLTLHTQGFSKEENYTLSKELNKKFSINSKIVAHKKAYVIQFSTKDANTLHDILKPYIISSMIYKLPRKINK